MRLGARSCSLTFQAPSVIWEILLVGDTLYSHLAVLTAPWGLVLRGYSSVQGEQAGSEERGSAQVRLGMGPFVWDAGTLDKNHICSGLMGVSILCLMGRTRLCMSVL